MVWIRGSRVVRGVAGVAIGWCAGEHVIHMTLSAADGDVGSCQGKGRLAVVEGRAGPRSRGVAGGAGGWKSRGNVAWIVGCCVVRLMAGVAVGG